MERPERWALNDSIFTVVVDYLPWVILIIILSCVCPKDVHTEERERHQESHQREVSFIFPNSDVVIFLRVVRIKEVMRVSIADAYFSGTVRSLWGVIRTLWSLHHGGQTMTSSGFVGGVLGWSQTLG